jgi:acyl-CoA thioester hydrolase
VVRVTTHETVPLNASRPGEHRLRRRVQFHETDASGVVHFSWFFSYMAEAEHALWRAAGLSIHAPEGDLAWPRIAASFDFHRALRFEDDFDVYLCIAEMSRKTIRYTCVITRGEEEIATGTMTIACVTRKPRMRVTDIPAAIAEQLAGRTLFDPPCAG